MIIYCCACDKLVEPRLTDGREIYPHRKDLSSLPFWICDECNNFVGCHHKTKNRTQPLGCIPTPEIKELRKEIHKEIDWLWRDAGIPRKEVYATMSKALGKEFHSAQIKTESEAREVLRVAMKPFDKWISERRDAIK